MNKNKEDKKLVSLCGSLAELISIRFTQESVSTNESKEQILEPLYPSKNSWGKKILYKYPHNELNTFEYVQYYNDNGKVDITTFINRNSDWETTSNVETIDKDTDFVIADLPFGIRTKGQSYELAWNHIFEFFDNMSSDSQLIVNLLPSLFYLKIGEKYRKELNNKGIFINAVFFPPRLIYPITQLHPYLVHFTKQKRGKIFVAIIGNLEDLTNTIIGYSQNVKLNKFENIHAGIYIEEKDFKGFENYLIQEEIKKLKTQYSEYEQKSLHEISIAINSVHGHNRFKKIQNSIFIPNWGLSDVKHDKEELKLKQKFYFQVVLNENFVKSKYTTNFFNSEIGRLSRDMLKTGEMNPRINKSSIGNAIIAIPPLAEQDNIEETYIQLDKLQSAIDLFSKELSINPSNSNVIAEKISDLLSNLSLLSEADKIKSIIRKGESKTREFKQSLSLDIRTQTKEKHIEHSAIKTIFAFLNTEGGILLIGVSDAGKITGIDEEIHKFHKKGTDSYLLHFKNLLKHSLGEGAYPLINYRIVQIDGKNVLLIECIKSDTPHYLKGVNFYVRTNPATDKLEGQKMMEYITRHFGGN